jgi:hypothetical protein
LKLQYLGDVNDYRKYALLRLIANTGLKIGVNWLLTPDDGRPDGNKRAYLAQREAWQHYDPELFDLMAAVPPTPSIDDFRQIERSGLIPDATYFDRITPPGRVAREEYHAASLVTFKGCDLVFFDPDNGMAISSVSKARSAGVKFVFDDELIAHYTAGRSLLIYQHFPHVERSRFMRELGVRLRTFAKDAEIWACHTAHVVFVLVANPSGATDHAGAIRGAVEAGGGKWPASFIKFEAVPGDWCPPGGCEAKL